MAKLEVTISAFVRSHGYGIGSTTVGRWGFQESATHTAFDSELTGPIFWAHGTLAMAKRALRESGATGTWTVLP